MNNMFASWTRRLGMLSLTAAAAMVSCTSVAQAEPDYGRIGERFSLVLQNAHFSRARFDSSMYSRFLDCYLRLLDPQKLYFSQEEVGMLDEKYGRDFGDYLLIGETADLAEKLYEEYRTRAVLRITAAQKLLATYAKNPPAFDSDREISRSRRKLPRAATPAALDQVWRDQVDDMYLTELCRRENLTRLAKEKGKPDPTAKEPAIVEKLQSRLKRMMVDVQECTTEQKVAHLLNSVAHAYDPHTDYMSESEGKRFNESIRASFVGIGAQLKEADDGSTSIEGIVKGGPAARNGQLKLGDSVVAVDTKGNDQWTDIMFMSLDKVVDLIRGEKGTTVRLRVTGSDGEERVISIVRDEIPMSETLASARIIEYKPTADKPAYKIGVLTLPSFYVDLQGGDTHCAADVKALLRRMKKEGVQGIVMDLRYNGGGSLDEVRKMVGFFTGAGPVVQVKDARGSIERLTVSGRPIFDGKMVVIINKGSASASEIFAGAMKDYGRAVIVGDPTTFGKGTVQMPLGLAEFMPVFSSREGCGILKITRQQFYRVNGASTQLKGVPSDIVLPTVTAGFDIGEAEQDYALPYDEIRTAAGYVRNARLGSIIPRLRALSQARVEKNPDMDYNIWLADYRRKLIEGKGISLNKQRRQAEADELQAYRRKVNEERRTRYAEMEKQDAAQCSIYRLKLADVNLPKLPIATKEDTEFMDEAEDPEEALEEDIDYPSELDPVMRESIFIVKDMIDLL